MRELVMPFGGEAVLAQRFVLGANLAALLHVGGEPKAAGASERVARERLEPVERALRTLPQPRGCVASVGLARDVVARGTAAQGEAAVAPARALGDPAGVVDTDAKAAAR